MIMMLMSVPKISFLIFLKRKRYCTISYIECCCLVTKSCPTLLLHYKQTTDRQAPLSMESPGRNTGVGCHFLLQGIFSTEGSNAYVLHWKVDSLP